MKYPIAIILLLTCKNSFSQNWHKAGDTLRLPESQSHFYTASGYLNRYDTVPCVYTAQGNETLKKGYKMVYVQSGFYTDKPNTLHVFFDDHLRRVTDVERFSFD